MVRFVTHDRRSEANLGTGRPPCNDLFDSERVISELLYKMSEP
uniref:Uncharacterized protein n=1 Tax=Candidatus Kentrum sp. FM TaxID=2126340 RepID=A0A450TFU1_9GAMM|nr:MAG: hypothetical protein BECKFM1743C_GA0114222_104112 [Candidatus Kentron sp. FM]VFJ70728.1 MAG: hypothetical protein BECKFM1743A_GA0114220_105584 [Candidatus Kentron sp. FM]VFK23782.1 MAG: hypothetical protein BECKFM1743B_GA0114221_109463 [Candidatus Kentron sp. FM]